MKNLLIFLLVLGFSLNAYAQTPYDTFDSTMTEVRMNQLKNRQFKLINADTAHQVKYMILDTESQTLSLYGKSEKLLGKKAIQVSEKKFLSEDPLTKKYPELTPYQFASNTPIMAIDLDGLEKFEINLERVYEIWEYNPKTKARTRSKINNVTDDFIAYKVSVGIREKNGDFTDIKMDYSMIMFERKSALPNSANGLKEEHIYGSEWVSYYNRGASIWIIGDRTEGIPDWQRNVGSGSVFIHSCPTSGHMNGCKLMSDETLVSRLGRDLAAFPARTPLEKESELGYKNSQNALSHIRKLYEKARDAGKLDEKQIAKNEAKHHERKDEKGNIIVGSLNKDREYLQIRVNYPQQK